MNSPISPVITTVMSSPAGAALTRTFVMKSILGLHARPSSLIVKTLQTYECQVTVACGDATVEAGSIFGLLSLAAGYDSRMTFVAAGRDATKALDAIQHLFETNFEEAY
jgi:phosphotransferase system HPr (HPr) family protein